ncbi:MAG: hypothetical protein K9M45_03030 [Kiritimatiellales bacterium]|nr:hypothetical protein [Kiritimatiellales bacterium]
MKTLIKSIMVGLVVVVVAGCASDVVYVPQLPMAAQKKLLAYEKLPPNKVFVIAIDPGGHYAYGFDSGKATLKEAAKIATLKCDKQRDTYGVASKTYIYAINDKVVYRDMIKASVERDKQEAQQKKAAKDAEQAAKAEQAAM